MVKINELINSLHPGDIRKLLAVSAEEVIRRKGNNVFKDFVNCLVFPKTGKSIPN